MNRRAGLFITVFTLTILLSGTNVSGAPCSVEAPSFNHYSACELLQDPTPTPPPAPTPSGIVFYNPRRPFPYWTGKALKYKSYNEAIQALAVEYGQSPQWVQKNMGESNDLSEIHQNLKNAN